MDNVENQVFGFIQNKKPDKETLHTMLQAAGMTPGVGNVADAADALLYLSEGKVGQAGLSALSMVPIIGQYIAGRRALKTAKKSGEEMVKVYRGVVDVTDPNTMVKKGHIVGNFSGKYNIGSNVQSVPRPISGVKFDRGNPSTYTIEKRRNFDGITVVPEQGSSQIMMASTLPVDIDDTNLLFTTTDLKYAKKYASEKGGMVLEFDVPKSYINKHARYASGHSVGAGGYSKKSGGYDKRTENFGFWDQHPNLIWTDGLPMEFLTKTHKL